MEVPRTLFASANKFAGADFKDTRFASFAAFGAAQASGELGSENMNRVPLLKHRGVTIGQGGAIQRYVAGQFGFLGNNELEAAQIDTLCECISEVSTAFGKVMPYGNSFTADEKEVILKAWLEGTVAEGNSERSKRALKWHLHHIEKLVGADGFSFGGKTTLADAKIYNTLGDVCELFENGPAQPFGADVERTDAVLVGYPKIKKIVETFKGSDGMTKYLAQRGPQGF